MQIQQNDLINFKQGFVGIDIGGTLAKICFIMNDHKLKELNIQHIEDLQSYNILINLQNEESIYFKTFDSNNINELIVFCQQYNLLENEKKVHITGGGSFKYQEILQKQLQIDIEKVNEFESLQKGLEYLSKFVNKHAFYFIDNKKIYLNSKNNYPFLLVNIGSGVSISSKLKIFQNQNIWKNLQKLIKSKDYLAPVWVGEPFLVYVNSLREQIHLKNYLNQPKKEMKIRQICLQKTLFQMALIHILSIQKVMIQQQKQNHRANIIIFKLKLYFNSKADLVKSILRMIAFNISQIGYLNARIENVNFVYFAGNFIRHHESTMACINQAFEFFSKKDGQIKHHDGFIGALGCLLMSNQFQI